MLESSYLESSFIGDNDDSDDVDDGIITLESINDLFVDEWGWDFLLVVVDDVVVVNVFVIVFVINASSDPRLRPPDAAVAPLRWS